MDSLVSTDWLANELGAEDLVVVDASWFMPASGRSGRAEFADAHIPGARFFDIDAVSDRSNTAPHMLPATAAFAAAMESLGIGSDNRIVVYDNSPVRSAARAWFTFRHFGARNVAILDGGLGKWRSEGRPVEGGAETPRQTRFDASAAQGDVVTKNELLADRHAPIIDARGAARFEGSEPDPRPGVAPGHIPGSRNLPFGMLYNEDGTFKPKDELARLFAEAGIDPAQPFVASCGSGVTASALLFAAHLLGSDAGKLYDGSWSEWGADPVTPKELGPAR